MMQEINYIRFGDYYIPDIRLPEENRPIGRWGRMHRNYIKEHNPIRFNDLYLSGELWTYLRRELKVHISHLCYILCTAAEDYYKNNKEKFDFIKYSIEDDRPKTFL